MKNPLHKRFLRELLHDPGKYLVIFLLLVVTIGFVSGFEVADQSIMKAYTDSLIDRNVEDGDFVTETRLSQVQKKKIEEEWVLLYDLPYYETNLTNGSTLRIFARRQEVNRECLMEGSFPEKDNEIAIDRMYAQNNHLSIGDSLQDDENTVYIITGLVALSDYSTLFQNNSDLMFDAVKFGTGIVTQDTFDALDSSMYTWNYAWKYKDSSIVGSEKEKDAADTFLHALSDRVTLKQFIPRYQNQAIMFAGEDMGSDGAMMVVFLILVMVIVAFVYALTTKDTLRREAGVIGTLRASGFTVKELVHHYMCLPLIVTLVSALIGNLIGYTFMKDLCAAMYYGSYSLPAYTTQWNLNAFLETTLLPCIVMSLITWIVLRRSLSMPIMQFLRHDLSHKKQRHAIPLAHSIPFFSRFRIRITLQNLSGYLVLFAGILFGNILLMFGLALPDILSSCQETMKENRIAEYQTILSVPSAATDEEHPFESMLNLLQFSKAVKTSNETAEKFSAYTLHTLETPEAKSDEVMLYGIADNSRYVTLPSDGVYVSYLYADKYGIKSGDTVTLYEEYEDKCYSFQIAGITDYKGSVSLFMPQKMLNETFDLPEEFFAGYFSDTPVEDIAKEYIGSVIDYDALTKVSRQLTVSMGNFMYLLDGFCIGLFVILMYLLGKILIEKNAQSVSMAKILGYSNSEIHRLYIRSMSIATVICIAISIPICSVVLVKIYRIMLKAMMTGWILFEIKPQIWLEMFGLGVLSYGVVAVLEIYRIRKIPMEQALKTIE